MQSSSDPRRSDSGLPFMKMHGLGNDFVVIDARDTGARVTAPLVAALADRHRGVGFDQMAVVECGGNADLHLTFYNADGSLSAACGNATRCIARYEMDRTGKTQLTITTDRGVLQAVDAGNGLTSVNMGHPMTEWDEIPLAEEMDTLALPLPGSPTATSMGNPHCTFFVDDVMAVDLAAIGPTIEHHPLFPQRTNVQFAQVIGEDRIRMRVWERGTGITLASGSSSCATAVAAYRRGLTRSKVEIVLDGGSLMVEWRDDGVWMTGATMHAFDGVLTQQFLDNL
ncbi:diaminopimelate epimerase [Ketogulonicigenium robustum]|uniref:Diaminopimelate epimerase n=2 Tax=Ketogulonicigenium robustum TaxID=92947 RepID=A0A1W6NWF3_9RHOB|nr:diaminopimelate epimerase [Ketogulonicigenium robustum]